MCDLSIDDLEFGSNDKEEFIYLNKDFKFLQ